MRVLAIDPGYRQSALVGLTWGGSQPEVIRAYGILPNGEALDFLRESGGSVLAVEMVASYGMPVGVEVFQTCVWVGRFIEAWKGEYQFIYRSDVKKKLCQNSRAKDSNIRQALIDRFGPQGTKRKPGPTYGLKQDLWAALGVAATFKDLLEAGEIDVDPLPF